MSPIRKFNRETYDSLKQYCLSCAPSLNLSEQVKLFLRKDLTGVVDRLDDHDPEVTKTDFLALVNSYFQTLDFCHNNYDDEKIQLVKEDIGNLFTYIDSLDLSPNFSTSFINNFFDRLNEYDYDESRGIYDLLTLDAIRNSRIMKNYLADDDNCFCDLIKFTKNIYKCFDNITAEEKEKIDYIFHSSYETLAWFVYRPTQIDTFFNKNILRYFNKESLSLLFRTTKFNNYIDFFTANEKILKVVATMNDYVLDTTGHNSEFLDRVLNIFKTSSMFTFKGLIASFFYEYHDKYLEMGLKKGLDKDEVFNELLSFILDPNNISFLEKYNVFDFDDLLKCRRERLENMYADAYGKNNILKIKYGVLDLGEDLIEYSQYRQLLKLKEAFFYRVYGINDQQAIYIKSRYGKFLTECENEFLEEDKATLEMLKTICMVSDLDIGDKEKIKELQISFYKYIKENGLFKTNKNASFMMVRALIDRMYMKTYNKVLYKPDLEKVLYHQRGVPIIDAGLDFNMIVSSINGVGSFFRNKDNGRRRYNTTNESNNQGLCTSFINNENLGVISLNGPILAYDNLDVNTLTVMGIGDIYSETKSIKLREANATLGEGNYFLTPKMFIDYTRFGYNEMVFDRFLFKDKDTSIKVQPSYVVVYKIDSEYKKTRMYKKGLQMAKEFGIPLVLIDVQKVKENEKNKILVMEDELFSKNKVDKDLMQEIITRYMNNYSGSLTICRSQGKRGNGWEYESDFAVDGLHDFLRKIDKKFEELDNEGIQEWYDALEACYDLEQKKNKYTHEITSYEYSLTENEFLLDDEIAFMPTINGLRNKHISRNLYSSDQVEKERVTYNPDPAIQEFEVIVNLANFLFEKPAFVTIPDNEGTRIYLTKEANNLSEEEKTDYGMIISYLLGNYNDNYFTNLDGCKLEELFFDKTKKYFKVELENSPIYTDKIRLTPLLKKLAQKVSDMDEDKFKLIFRPIIGNEKEDYVYSDSNMIEDRLMKRKEKIVYHFSKLPTLEVNIDQVETTNDKKSKNYLSFLKLTNFKSNKDQVETTNKKR